MSRTTRYRRHWDWKLVIAIWLAMNGAIAFWADCALAQITPDNTLGAESSIVTPDVDIKGIPSDLIDGGATRGANLFHSFREFNIDEGRGAYFTNPTGVENIIGRVTGGSRSDILGKLGVLGNANLFLINPHGIVFGPNASLDVGGSFIATTANALQFQNQGIFSASNPNAPPLLTIKPSAFLFNQIATQPINSIENRGFLSVPDGQSLLLVGGKISPTLTATGAILNEGFLSAPSGRVELGGLTAAGTVGLNVDGNSLSLSFPDGITLADVALTESALINVSGDGGSIAINARNLDIFGGFLLAGINSGRGSVNTQAGDITLNATGAITVASSENFDSQIFNSLSEEAVGKGGNINIKARSLSFEKTSMSTFTNGLGNAGNISIQVGDSVAIANSFFATSVSENGIGEGGDINIKAGGSLFLDNSTVGTLTLGRGNAGNLSIQVDDAISLTNSSFTTSVLQQAVGNGGNIEIKARSLFFTDKASIDTFSFGQGNGGNVSIVSDDSVAFIDSGVNSTILGNFPAVVEGAVPKGGDINIQTGSLSLENQARLDASTDGRGNGGKISVQARDSVFLANSSIDSTVRREAVGNGGDISIQATSLLLTDNASLNADISGRGNAGNIEIKANSLSVYDSRVRASTSGQGDAGNVFIQASDSISLVNSDIDSDSNGEIFDPNIGELAGNAGDINILTGSLFLNDESGLSSSTYGWGDAGNVSINASGYVSFAGDSSILSASTSLKFLGFGESEAEGKGGNISIIADSLALDDTVLTTATSGKGDAGDIFLQINNFSTVANNSQITSAVAPGSQGDGGDINIQTRSLQLKDGSQIRANVENSRNNLPAGRGQGGTIQINASELVSIFGVSSNGYSSGLSTATAGIGKAGSLTITTPILLMSDGAQVSTATLGPGEGGSLNVNASESVLMSGISTDENFTTGLSTRTTGSGKAGSLTITSPVLLLADGAQIDASTVGTGEGGSLNINASQWVQIFGTSVNGKSGSGLFTRTEGAGTAGSLTITTPELSVYDGAQIDAGTSSSGQGGNLNINASESVLVFGESVNRTNVSTLTTQAEKTATGKAGSLTINTPNLFVFDGGQIDASTEGAGEGGSLNINASESVSVFGTSFNERSPSGLFTETEGMGKAGSLTINTPELVVSNGGLISAGTRSLGEGGNLNINASKSVLAIGESVNGRAVSTLSTQASQTAIGKAGTLTINTPELLVLDGGQVDASTFGAGEGGSLNINASQSVQVNGISADGQSASVLTTRTQGMGKAGTLTINTPELFVLDGGQVDASTFGSGEGGSLDINASKTVQVIGTSAGGQSISVLSAQTQGTGKAGDMSINTPQLLIFNGGQATVSSLATGVAGNLDITANSVELNNGRITGQTFSGNGGNLTLNIADFLVMRQGSEISTTAGTAQQGGDGGNIQINTPNGFIVAVPSEDSDISANAFTGRGGRVDITARGIFGIQPRSDLTSLSDITASSEFGINGFVEINTPDVDPNQGLVNLPDITVDTEIVQGCTAGGTVAKSEFNIIGRGGLPPNPGEALNTDAVQVDLVTLNPEVAQHSTAAVSPSTTSPTPNSIVEAQGWVIDANGNVTLTANTPHTVSCQK
ncbi:filamentous hemagglutinin N-terminal domain-containing protein [Dendronalium sp. ChiSLP03b]|uniref:two-partner secretion domain-containing protein n=1 Tax=Dendronalium sp. ChiSLP03b TaxID=3075381 RepID=UPI002AD563D7|nr:filamentous hemagglutinin N-terminal domain-containing protein [Dendronalium sp. ChiSLP03b]MDZ8206829.1 filamentous hemagglutinin N-terminal domain-containing protein [Dendronalium sp. ChiSLP03b]